MDPASSHQPLLCSCGENELTPVHVRRRMSIHSVDSYFFLVATLTSSLPQTLHDPFTNSSSTNGHLSFITWQ
jgi:hypothetical protein